MKETYWLVLILILGIICIAFINFFQTYTNTDEQNYMLLKEVTEAAMYDAVDMTDSKLHGQLSIDREKFVENFVRRFSESVTLGNTYVIEIYDVNETPPKVSLKVSTKLRSNVTAVSFSKSEVIDFDIENRLDAILETTY
jgi:hypothetical protein